MKYLVIILGGICLFLGMMCISLAKELRQRKVNIQDLAETAAEISAKTSVSYDTAFQSLVTLTYSIPHRIRK